MQNPRREWSQQTCTQDDDCYASHDHRRPTDVGTPYGHRGAEQHYQN